MTSQQSLIPPAYFGAKYFSSGSYKTYQQDARKWTGPMAKRIVMFLRRQGINQPRILDVGCTFGWLLAELQRTHGCDITGLEYSPWVVARADRSVRRRIKQGNVLDRKVFPPRNFDTVICFDVVNYLTPAQTKIAINDLVRWCRGYIFFSAVYKHSHWASQKLNPDPGRITTLSQREYRKLFQSAGAHFIQSRNWGNYGSLMIFSIHKRKR